jgi:hypothetical protein
VTPIGSRLVCTTCGVRSFGHGKVANDEKETYSVNVRCLRDVDADSLPVRHYDGKSL